MFNNKQIYWLGSLALVLAFVFVQQQVFAQWAGPTTNPDGSANLNVVTNPLDENLDLHGFNLTNGGTANFSDGSIDSLQVTTLNGLDPATFVGGGGGGLTNPMTESLDLGDFDIINVDDIDVRTINGVTPVFGGGVTNPLSANLSGRDQYGITNLKGCDPARSRGCGAIEAIAGKSTFNDSYAYGVFGQTLATSGIYPSYGVYGLALNSGGAGVMGYSTLANAIGVYGAAKDVNGIAGLFSNQALGGKALVTNGLTELNGATTINAGVTIEGYTTIHDDLIADGSITAGDGIIGQASPVGVYGVSSIYGGMFRGTTAIGWNPPDDGGVPDFPVIGKLFGITQTLASVNGPAALGLVAAGGYERNGGNFDGAGVGICAVSGEKTYDAEGDFYLYCQDTGGFNNYAGFFAGDVYVKEGSLQIRDALAAPGENLIYANATSALAGSHLLKLQTAGVDKFLVDKDGKVTVDTNTFFVDAGNDRVGIGTITPSTKLTVALPFGPVLGDGVKVTRGTGRLLMGQGTGDASNFVPIVSGKSVGDAPFMIRGIQSDAQSAAEAFRFSAARADENGVIEDSDLAMTFYNWTSHLMSIKGDGTVGIGVLNPNSSYKLDVAGSINSTGGYRANGAAGLNSTINVRNAAGSGSCTLTIRGGLVTATTCP
ncbi:hypothetical protein KBC40_00665 [Patescibacteria group bacterium]|nr:hypothetical protein [Patescibacteria group bacterium]